MAPSAQTTRPQTFFFAPRPMTPEQKAAAKAKRAATRKARGIIGSRKRAAVKGDVTGVVVTPVTASEPARQTAGSVQCAAST